jgi:2-dehydropantoate 2-reductase
VVAARSICIAGAGSIGCFVGGVLALAGRDVSMLARARILEEIGAQGLRLTSVEGFDRHLAANQLSLSDDPAIFRGAGTILVAVKSGDTADMADLLARYAPEDAVIISLQNGVGNVGILRERLPERRVLAGMVPFNVVAKDAGHVHRATSGAIVIERDAADTAGALSVPHLAMRATENITDLQWGKLLVNLNNALNALSDIPLRSQLAQREWRRLFADQMAEGLGVLKASGIRPISATPVPAGVTPHLLRLPDGLFSALLGRTMKIDANARSSMWEDLQRGRRTEVDYLQGVVVQLAMRQGIKAPLAQRVMELIKSAEASGRGSPALTPQQIRGSLLD